MRLFALLAGGTVSQSSAQDAQLLNRFVAWAEDKPDVRAALLIGSRARADHPADPWSDIDLVLTVRDVQPYLNNGDWLEEIAPVWTTHVESTLAGVLERRVLFEGGHDFDVVLVTDTQLSRLIQTAEVVDIIRRGIRVLIDKDRLMSRITLPLRPRTTYMPPTQAEFLNVVNDFWFHAAWTAKKLRRGELWAAITSCDGYMKRLLLKMMEWHARAVSSHSYDTWFSGRFVEEWGDSRALAELGDAFAHYNAPDIKRALLASMDLFRWLATETAVQFTYPYPSEGDSEVTRWVQELLEPIR
nr:MAG: hypothetical protein DIU68_03190 [Chloroflexota bacterium]